MDARLALLLKAVRQAGGSEPTELLNFLRGLPEVGSLPSPWETWTLIGLLRHRERQLWVAEIISTRLGGSPHGLATMGEFGRPEGVPQSGAVPGLPEWEYYFHGIGCCMTHKVDGVVVDVDFWDDSAEYFNTFFYEKFLESLHQPEPPEQRLLDLHPSARAMSIAVFDMIAAKALVPLSYWIADAVLDYSDVISAFCRSWAAPEKRIWLAALIGDWLAADEAAAGLPDLAGVTGPRAERCQENRRIRLRSQLGEQRLESDALQALAQLGAADLDQRLEDALRGPPTGLTSTALEIIGRQKDARWCRQVFDLSRRVEPDGQIPEPCLWITSLKFLIGHGYQLSEVLAELPKAGGSIVGEAILMSLEHAPEMALPLIRKSLLDDIPINRIQAAAILALINKPWSRRELLRGLEVSNDQIKTAYARAALLETGDEAAQKSVLAWEKRNPHQDEPGSFVEIGGRRIGPFYTVSEISLMDRASRIRYEMEQLHDRVIKVKEVVPPEPPKPRRWWQPWSR